MVWFESIGMFAQAHPIIFTLLVIAGLYLAGAIVGGLMAASGGSGSGSGYSSISSYRSSAPSTSRYTKRVERTGASARAQMNRRSADHVKNVRKTIRR